MSDEEDFEDIWANYDSGPFCIHWESPLDCEELCTTCGHMCKEHPDGTDCEREDCKCIRVTE